jgi:hypothetical protein
VRADRVNSQEEVVGEAQHGGSFRGAVGRLSLA